VKPLGLLETWSRAARTAFAFLTRLPVDAGDVNDVDMARSAVFFPVVGWALGLACVALARLHAVGLPTSIVAVLIVALLAALTGGLHLDGVADLFDGLAGGRGNRERTLEIMRDSRIGAHGALALVLVVVLKIVALRELLERGDSSILVVVPAVARWAVLPQLAFFPYARAAGLGHAFEGRVGIAPLAVATSFVGGLVVLVHPGFPWLLAAVLAVSLAIAVWLRHRLGGLTGDIYGATIELCEATALVVAAVQ
jgi:adenosylcobinamide-GDP ribazoletransferase